MFSKLYVILILIYFTNSKILSQNVPEHINNDVHEFLDRLTIKNIIELNSEVRPFTISKIKKILVDLEANKSSLNEIEAQKLDWFMYKYNLRETKMWWNLSYEVEDAFLGLHPIAGYSVIRDKNAKRTARVGGVRLISSFKNDFGAYVHLQDRGIFGDQIDTKRYLTPQRFYEFQSVTNGIEFSDVVGGISYNWNWGNLLLAKDYNMWGHGNFGQLILGNKAASYPFLKFEYLPVDWFRFRYIFGCLNSIVLDSTSYYHSTPGSKLDELRYDFINKYLVTNMLTISPFPFLDFSLGNSLVYSGNLRLETYIPFMFFKYLDRDVGKGSIKDGNGQLFFDASFNYFNGLRFYGTFFIDVISIRKTLKGDDSDNWFAYTVGSRVIDIPIDNLEINLEYTKINPWVYEHKDITTTYKHLNATLGHWIGQNADHLKCEIIYYPIFNLKTSLYVERIRKGGEMDIYYSYKGRNEFDASFLYPPVRKEFRAGLNINYEIFPYLYLDLRYDYSNISDEDKNRTYEFELGKRNSLILSLTYGIPY